MTSVAPQSLEEQFELLLSDKNFIALRDARLSRFNLFEVLGEPHRELRHSNFLAFLLRREAPHGLGDRVLRAMISHADASLARVDLTTATVRREEPMNDRDRLDLLVLVPNSRLLVAIENKINAREGSGQLARYEDFLRARWPRW